MQSSLDHQNAETKETSKTTVMTVVTSVLAVICVILAASVTSLSRKVMDLEEKYEKLQIVTEESGKSVDTRFTKLEEQLHEIETMVDENRPETSELQEEDASQEPRQGFFGQPEEDGSNNEAREEVPEDQRGMIGIQGLTLTAELAKENGSPSEGVYVASVLEGSKATDLQAGDIITGFNSIKISSMEELQAELCYHKAGEKVTIFILRIDANGEYNEHIIEVVLIERSEEGVDEESVPAESGEVGGFPFGS